MDPKEFNWSAEQQVVVTNPTSQNVRFQVHSKWYEVPAAKTVKMPGFIAWSYVYNLAVQMALADGEFDKWNEDGEHQKYYDKIVVSVEEIIQAVAAVESDVTTFDTEDDDLDSDPLGDEEDESEQSDQKEKVKPMERKRGRPAQN